MTELQNLYEAILEVKFDRRNFYNKMLKLGILSEAEPRQANATNRTPNKYRLNAEKYAELKKKDLDWNFKCRTLLCIIENLLPKKSHI